MLTFESLEANNKHISIKENVLKSQGMTGSMKKTKQSNLIESV